LPASDALCLPVPDENDGSIALFDGVAP
jgi:hypothetical protein